jgi:type IV pilus assembly protein PilW
MNARRSRGFTLVDMLVGSALGLLIVGLIGGLYLNSKQLTRINESVARLQENGRFIVQQLDDNLRMAGFSGCAGVSNAPVNVLNGATTYPYQFDVGLAGNHGDGSGFTPGLDASLSLLSTPPAPAYDVVTVRRADGPGLQLLGDMASGTSTLTVGSASPVAAGDILLVADCAASAIFQATGVSGGVISHGAAPGTPGNASADLGHAFHKDATLYRLVSRTYYVAPSVSKPGTNSIWVYSLPNYDGVTQPVEWVEGVEGFVLLYGEDNDGDRAANRYVTADAVGTWANVVSTKPMVLVASTRDNMTTSPQPYTFNSTTPTTPTDRRLRSSLVSVVTLRNRVP